VIHLNGDVDSTANKDFFRGFNELGAHVKGYNEGNVGICLIGRDRFTWGQFWSLRNLTRKLCLAYKMDYHNVWCHAEFSHVKTCPNIRNGELISFLHTGEKKYIDKYLVYGKD
jgi:hypothetical protein